MREDGARAPLFVTGGTGFVGRAFLARVAGGGRRVSCLCRGAGPLPDGDGVRRVSGDLLNPERYAAALEEAEVVVHCAALTGKASSAEHFRANADGTRALVDACVRAGGKRFLHVSTIAAAYPGVRHYPYALSKAEAERIVAASGLAHTIVRPTVVLGAGSTIGRSLARAVRAPVVPLFGDSRVQPVHVHDVAEVLAGIVEGDRFDGEVLDAGGPEAVPWPELLARIGKAVCGRSPRLLRVPGRAAVAVLGAIESVTGPVLPVTAAQIYAFLCDGSARADFPGPREGRAWRSLDAMIQEMDADG
ncbi:MAG: NAD-dependent epimerase/dehydratase family protein [Gemmatimonadota bacterium]|nr:hypothetical protein [Gemmatimonadota bacterium]MDP6802665.1 NAD-dependent epimerase/dehydratase family protein [Gemmatimonadota bacterium]